MSMVVPQSLQSVWTQVAADGVVNRADVETVKKVAGNNPAPEVKKFIDNLEEGTKDNKTISVETKAGSAQPTVNFIDGNESKPSTDPIDQEIAKLEVLKEKAAKSPNTKSEVEAIDKAINELKAKKNGSIEPKKDVPADNKVNGTEPKKDVKPKEEPAKPDELAEEIKRLEALREKAAKSPAAKSEVEAIDKTIAELKKKHFLQTGKDIIDNAKDRSAERLDSDKKKLNGEYDGLTPENKENPEVKSVKDKANAEIYNNSKTALIKDINKIIDDTVADVLKTGDKSKFSSALKQIDELLGKYKGLDDDPIFKKIKAILAGAPEAQEIKISADNKVMQASKMVDSANSLAESKTFGRAEKRSSEDLVSKLPEGELRKKLETRLADYGKTQELLHEQNRPETVKALKDMLKTPFLGIGSGKKEDATRTMLGSIAQEKDASEILKMLDHDEQVKAIKILSKSSEEEYLRLARELYDKKSSITNIDDEFDKETLDKLKTKPAEKPKDDKDKPNGVDNTGATKPVKKEASEKEINEYAKSLSYAINHEDSAALTMARGILEGKIPEKVIAKLNKNDLADLVNIVGKKGRPGEREDLLDLAGQLGVPLKTENLDKGSKNKLLNQYMTNPNFNEADFAKQLKEYSKKEIFDFVLTEPLTTKDLALVAKYTDGDKMCDDLKVGKTLLSAMLKEYADGNPAISRDDVMKFLKGVEGDADRNKVARRTLDDLGDGPESAYAKLRAKDPSLLDRVLSIRSNNL
ncbi:MAG: hypothetical protein U0457_06600 [Candidatus Sericytochromatia bacterium]